VTQPVIAGGVLYVGTSNGKLVAVDLASGSTLWTFKAHGPIDTTPAVFGNLVYVQPGQLDPTLYALDVATGRLVWGGGGGYAGEAPAVSGGVLFDNVSHTLQAYDAVTGTSLWTRDFFDWFAVGGDTLFASSSQSNSVCALEASTGSTQWCTTVSLPIIDNLSTFNGVVYASGDDGRLIAIDGSTGDVLWVFHANTRLPFPATIAQGVVYVESSAGTVYAIDAATGMQVWTYVASTSRIGPVTVAGGVAYVTEGPVALDATTGSVLWQHGDAGAMAISDGVVYTTDYGKYVRTWGLYSG
jgi:outer membrane protein assembly factor BamB